MIKIDNNSIVIEFKKGSLSNDAENCIKLAMEMLNLSKSFNSLIKRGQEPSKKMNQTGRIRLGIQKFVNKDGVTPIIIDKIISMIRNGNLKEIKTQVGGNEIILYSNNDVSGFIAQLMVEKVI
jgi:hypothetical protein